MIRGYRTDLAMESVGETSGRLDGVRVSTHQAGNIQHTRIRIENDRAAETLGREKGEYITLISKEGNWWYVQYSADGYGYCSADYIAQQSGSYEAYVATSSGRLNVRSGPSTGYSVKATLAKGSKVVVLSQSGDFYKVLYNGRYVGCASKKYIKVKKLINKQKLILTKN